MRCTNLVFTGSFQSTEKSYPQLVDQFLHFDSSEATFSELH